MVTTTTRAPRAVSRLVLLTLLAMLAVTFLSAFAPAPAAAATPSVVSSRLVTAEPAACSDPTVPDQAKSSLNCGREASQWALPVERWADSATSLHLRGGDSIMTDLANRLQRDATYPMLMSVGNSLWSWSTSMTSMATRFDMLNAVGAQADQAAATLGKALMSSGLVMMLVAASIGAAIWRSSRGRGGSWKPVAKSLAVVGVMAAMIGGASASTHNNGNYQPGRFSPGWIVSQTNGIVSSLASAPALALDIKADVITGAADNEVNGPASCAAYTTNLQNEYVRSASLIPDPVKKAGSAVPLLMSRMWESTGLEAWKVSQFGHDNDYADFMYCRLLEQRAGFTTPVQVALTTTGANLPTVNQRSAAWGTAGNNDAEDRNLIAWALCRPSSDGTSWTVAGDWSSVTRGNGKHTPTADDCKDWWNDDYYKGDSSGETGGIISGDTNNFEFSGDLSDTIDDTGNAPGARNFLISLHGAGSGVSSNLVLVMSYVFSAFILFVVFGLISLAILVAKVASIVMILVVFLVMLKDIIPSQDPSSAAAKYFKSYLGVAFVAFGASLVFSFISLITGFLVQAAASWFGGASVMAMLWTGVAPMIAVVVMHVIFKKVLKLPSPFSITGAQSWAAAAGGGAIGGAMGAGAMGALQNRGRSMATGAGRTVGNAAMSKATGGRMGSGATKARAGGFSETAKNGSALGQAATGSSATASTKARTGKMTPAAPQVGQVPTAAERKQARVERKQSRAGKATAGTGTPEATSTGKGGRTGGDLNTWLDEKSSKVQAKDAERAAARSAARDATVARRGYAGGALGDVREALGQRLSNVGAEFAERPVRKSLTTAAKIAGGAGLIVATGGVAAPIMAGVRLAKEPSRMLAARKFAIANGDARQANAAAAVAAKAARLRREQREAAGQEQAPAPGAGRAALPGSAQPPATTPGTQSAARLNGQQRVTSRPPRTTTSRAVRSRRVAAARTPVAAGARRPGSNVPW